MKPFQMMHNTRSRMLINGLLCLIAAAPCGHALAGDIEAVSARLKAASAKSRASVEAEYANSKDKQLRILAQWHKAKERVLTKAVADGEISEKEADFLRVEIIKVESGGLAAPAGESTKLITAAQLVKSMDKNGDGRISRTEASEELKMFFEHYDLNKNGKIDEKEAAPIASYVNREKPGSKGLSAQQIISLLDRNADGKLSKDEASKEIKPYFEYIDKNQDGLIDAVEAKVMEK